MMRYDDVTIPLILTDEDFMQNKPAPAGILVCQKERERGEWLWFWEYVPTGQYKALILSFNLPSSSYATMLFRELLKVPTSKLIQKTLSEDFASRDNKKDDKGKKNWGGDGNFNRNAYEKGKRKRDGEK